jgi:riboflavin synthase
VFSGIIEANSKILEIVEKESSVQIMVQRPVNFDDIKLGDSICVNGICLTAEKFNKETMTFSLGIETLKILNHGFSSWKIYDLNLERSLKFGDRVHGHLVTGHVDQIGQIVGTTKAGECWLIKVKLESFAQKAAVWKKGSIAINGISLTVNEVEIEGQAIVVSVCLIPETIANTNLAQFKVNEPVMVETDYLAKAYFTFKNNLKIE